MRKTVLILVSALAAVSCRLAVMEDREECPSLLYFQVFNAGAFGNVDRVHVDAFSYPGQSPLCSDTTTIRALEGHSFCLSILRADAVRGSGVLGYRRCHPDDNGKWTVEPGSGFDSLFRFSYLTFVEPESFTVPVEFVKEYSNVTLEFISADDTRFPFDVVIRSGTCGLDALTGEPVKGDFYCQANEGPDGLFHCLLPRQADDSLVLELYGRPGLYPVEGLAHSFNLGAVLRESGGISWQEKNLPDVLVAIDFKELDLQVQVTPWENESINYAH